MFIAWAPESVHPSTTSPTGCKLESFTIATPESEVLNRLLSVLEISLPVHEAQAERYTLALDCPRGRLAFKTVPDNS
jgi:hypothetical protein